METDRVSSMADILAERVRQAAERARESLTRRADTQAPSPPTRRLPKGYEFADWSQVRQAEQVRQMLRAVQREAAWPLYIYGNPGSGKTCIAALIYEAFTRRPMWSRADDFLLEYVDRGDGRKALQAKVEGTPCLFLDDLGVRPPTPPMLQAIFDVLEMRKGRPVVIVSNHDLRKLSEIYDERIVSRLSAGTVLEIRGQDRRRNTGRKMRIE